MYQNQLAWAAQPTHIRIFLIYLFVVICITAVQLLRLVLVLGWTASRKRISVDAILDGSVTYNVLCEAGFAKRLQFSEKEQRRIKELRASQEKSNMALNVIRAAEPEFAYLSRQSQIRVQLLKFLFQLTLLLSIIVVIYGAYPTWLALYNDGERTGVGALVETGRLLSDRLLVGLLVSAVLLISYGCCERALVIRRAKWSYFVHACKDELTAE